MKIILISILFFSSNIFSQTMEINKIDSLLTLWHHSAAIADEQTYFNMMSDQCIFLGTDKSERWTKKEFEKWSEPYFKQESAWNIYSIRRNIFLSDDKMFAWFDEDLVAGIGDCRGSGILIKQNTGWKIIQYNLALTVPNDLADDLKRLVETYNENSHSK